MIWCRFSTGGEASYGIVEADTVRKVDGIPWGKHAVASQGVPLGSVKL